MSESLKLAISTPFRSFGCASRFPDSLFGAGEATKAAYTDALVAEISRAAAGMDEMLVDEVELCCGPASCLSSGQLARVMRTVRTNFNLAEDVLVHGIEVPGGLSVDHAGFCKNNHVSYLEIEQLSADPLALKALGLPSANDACVMCFQVAYFTGAPCLGILLDASLDKDMRRWHASINQALGRSPLFVRACGLAGADAQERVEALEAACARHGMSRVGAGALDAPGTLVFGQEGFAGLPGPHENQLGFGLNAVSHFDGVSFKNTGDLSTYTAHSTDFTAIARQI